MIGREVDSSTQRSREPQGEIAALARAEFQFVSVRPAEEVIPLCAAQDHLLEHVSAQGIADFFRSVFGMKTFLKQINRIAVTKAELRGRDLAIELEQPEFQPSARLECM